MCLPEGKSQGTIYQTYAIVLVYLSHNLRNKNDRLQLTRCLYMTPPNATCLLASALNKASLHMLYVRKKIVIRKPSMSNRIWHNLNPLSNICDDVDDLADSLLLVHPYTFDETSLSSFFRLSPERHIHPTAL